MSKVIPKVSKLFPALCVCVSDVCVTYVRTYVVDQLFRPSRLNCALILLRTYVRTYVPAMSINVLLSLQVSKGTTVLDPKQKMGASPLLVWPPPEVVDGVSFCVFSQTSDWLCRFLTGMRATLRPLARSDLFDVVKSAFDRATEVDGGVAPSQHLGLSTRKPKKSKKQRLTTQVVDVEVPGSGAEPGEGATASVLLKGLRRSRGVLLLEFSQKSLVWMSEYVSHSSDRPKRSLQRHGSIQKSPEIGVFYSRSDESWVCRGPLSTRKFKVQRTAQDGSALGLSCFRACMEKQRVAAQSEMSQQRDSSQLGTTDGECSVGQQTSVGTLGGGDSCGGCDLGDGCPRSDTLGGGDSCNGDDLDDGFAQQKDEDEDAGFWDGEEGGSV